MNTANVTKSRHDVQAVVSALSTSPGDKLYLPHFFCSDIVKLLRDHPDLLWSFLGVIVPMGLINAIGSLQNIESAEAAGDRFSTGPCMAVNGISTIAAGLFGSCFPTTIYIGHPGWKALGARCGYSIINGLFFTVIFIFGLGSLIVHVIPMEAGMAIVLYIGIIIAAQSYEAVPTRHYPAVALGFFPAVAMMAVFLLPHVLHGIGASEGILPMIEKHTATLEDATKLTDAWWPVGVYALAGANCGFVITGMIVSAITAFLIDRRFRTAGFWCAIAAVVTLLGFQHAYRIEPGAYSLSPRELLVWQRTEPAFGGTPMHLDAPEGTFFHRGYRIAGGYALAAAMLFLIDGMRKRRRGFEDIAVDVHGAGPPPRPEPESPILPVREFVSPIPKRPPETAAISTPAPPPPRASTSTIIDLDENEAAPPPPTDPSTDPNRIIKRLHDD
jgi:AGZA family xanthine/uracil permease-like MFS transporter